jgi:hypothetical protein
VTDYHKIAAIVLRGFACYLLLFSVIEWITIAVGALLTAVGWFSRYSVNFEGRLLASVVYLIAGLILYARSGSIARRIVEGLKDEQE